MSRHSGVALFKGRSLADGRYVLDEELGEGATSVVYRARDRETERWVAIKILSPVLARHLSLHRRFKREAEHLGRLAHRGIVEILNFGQDGDLTWIVMEYVPGGSVDGWIGEHGPMPARLALELLLQVCDAVGSAHAIGLVHRDLKPGNILVAADSSPRVADFGIARVMGEASLTATGLTIGTLGFMAPEQEANPKGVDHRADIYSLGATLLAMVNAETPFDPLEALEKARLPDPLARAILKATMEKPKHRWADTAAFAKHLSLVRALLGPVPEGTPSLYRGPAALRIQGEVPTGASTSVEPCRDTMVPEADLAEDRS